MDERETVEVGRLELREERPRVEVERVRVGAVVVRREVETRTETVEVELTSEVLVIENHTHQGGEGGEGAAVFVGGERLEPGGQIRLEIYREAPKVGKVVELREEVRVLKTSATVRQPVPVELGREVLVVEREGEVRVSEA